MVGCISHHHPSLLGGDDKTSYQILYVTEETKQLILSRTFLGQLGVVSKDFHIKGVKGEESNLGGVRTVSRPWPPTESNADTLGH